MLEVGGLTRAFGGVQAVDGLSFAVERGTITGLIGPNGAGKSTAVELISGFSKPDSGSVVYEGVDVAGWTPERIVHEGMVRTFQLSNEFARMTVMENLLVAAAKPDGLRIFDALANRRRWLRDEQAKVEQATELLDRFDLHDHMDAYAGELSGGQKRLLEIIRGLMTDPALLLLDEPFAGVNPTLGLNVERHLLSLREEGLTMLLIEHEMEIIERLCDTVIVMAEGRTLAEGPLGELRSNQGVVDAYLN